MAAEEQQRCRELISSIPGVTYLEHTSATIQLPRGERSEGKEARTIRIFGSPFSPSSHSEPSPSSHDNNDNTNNSSSWAFQYAPSASPSAGAVAELWAAVPGDADIVVTHTPAAGRCDASAYWDRGGCVALLARLSEVRPALHVCGHCHEGRGAEVVRWGGAIGASEASGADAADAAEGDASASASASALAEVAVESVRRWSDPGGARGSKKQSLLDLTGSKKGGQKRLEKGRETAVVNASIMGQSFSRRGPKEPMRKPVVVDVFL